MKTGSVGHSKTAAPPKAVSRNKLNKVAALMLLIYGLLEKIVQVIFA
jgi:hypothetical protein